jgi:hypothetical protein
MKYKTEKEAIAALLKTARSYLNYIEKASNEDLENPSGNVGNKNFVVFAEILKKNGINCPNGVAWCDSFCDCMMVLTFGKIAAEKMIGVFSFYTPDSANAFKKMDRYTTIQKDIRTGDQIFFQGVPTGERIKRICHTGICTGNDGKIITVIEGNSSSEKKLVREGGRVVEKSYKIGTTYIHGAGRPVWGISLEN